MSGVHNEHFTSQQKLSLEVLSLSAHLLSLERRRRRRRSPRGHEAVLAKQINKAAIAITAFPLVVTRFTALCHFLRLFACRQSDPPDHRDLSLVAFALDSPPSSCPLDPLKMKVNDESTAVTNKTTAKIMGFAHCVVRAERLAHGSFYESHFARVAAVEAACAFH